MKEFLKDEQFLRLTRTRARIAIALTIATMVVYYGFILMVAFGKDFLTWKISTHTTVGIPIGVGVIVLSWVFTGIYVRWANSRYDAMVEDVKKQIKEKHG